MKRRNKIIGSMLVLFCLYIILFPVRRSLNESKAANHYYENYYYAKFESYTDVQKNNYLQKLPDTKITIPVEELMKLDDLYYRLLNHKYYYMIEYTITDFEKVDGYTFKFIKVK